MNPRLPGFLESLAPTLDRHGYLAVALFVMLEDFGIPVPGETILIAASIYAGAGRLNIVVVGLVAVAAAIVGDNIGYAIGRFGGRPLVERFGRYVFITPARLDKATKFFERQGPKIVVIARFIEGLRQANGIVAGIAEMPWLTFLAFNALGAVLWVGVWTSLGYLAGAHITTIYDLASRYAVFVVIAAVLIVAVLVLRHLRRRRAESRATSGEDERPTPDAEPH